MEIIINRLKSFYVVLTYFLLISSINAQKFDAVKITTYYDAAGNSSAAFFIEQLYPAYAIIGDQIILELIPFCLAAMQPGTYNYQANVLHQCAFGQTDDQKLRLEFATCLIKFGRNTGAIKEHATKCANQTNLPIDAIISCAEGDEGRKRLANNGFATQSVYPSLYQLPAVANNGWVNAAQQRRAKQDFLGYVCACLNNPPAGCIPSTNA